MARTTTSFKEVIQVFHGHCLVVQMPMDNKKGDKNVDK